MERARRTACGDGGRMGDGLLAEYLRLHDDWVISRAAKVLEPRHEALYARLMSELWMAMTSAERERALRIKAAPDVPR